MNDIKIFKIDEQEFIEGFKQWCEIRKNSPLYFKFSHKKESYLPIIM